MLPMMLLAHLLGDYPLQTNAIARWKARSILGVLAHGGIVTLTHVVLAVAVMPSWWPYALLIGGIHTVVDVIRAHFLRTQDPMWSMLSYLGDQLIHVVVIVAVVAWSGASFVFEPRLVMGVVFDWKRVTFFAGYLVLFQPAWVLLRFFVRGVWGAQAAPPLGCGEGDEKYAPMVERVLIASLVLFGQLPLVPLVLLPRRLQAIRAQDNGVLLWVRPTAHWAETILGVALAMAVGLVLRIVVLGA